MHEYPCKPCATIPEVVFPMRSPLSRWFILVPVLGCLILGCSKGSNERPPDLAAGPVTGGELRLAAQSPESLDPILSNNYWESEIALQIFDGLVRFDANLNTVAALAQDWRVSPDGRTYVFTLRPGVRFHHGREITAEDFVYSLTRLLDPKWKSNDAQYYGHILGAADFQAGRSSTVSGLQALNPTTLQIVLDEPYSPFLRLLAQQPASVVPKELVESTEHPFGQNPVGRAHFIWSDGLLEPRSFWLPIPTTTQVDPIWKKCESPLSLR